LERVAPSAPAAEEKSFWFNWNWWGLGIGALATAIVALVLTLNLNRTRSELEKVKEQLAAVQRESAQKDEQLRLLSSSDVRLVELRGLETAPAAQGKFFWNPTLGLGLLVVNGLPQTPAGKAYELWGIAGNEPVAAGVFSVDEKGQARFNMPAIAKQKIFDKFAVTVEPAAGVVQPTGPMVLLGSL
jgi:anti-sigma-K factor RskA